jgi:hypothetical protein
MSCAISEAIVIAAGVGSGVLVGFLFRNSDAERDQATRNGFRSWYMKLLYAPILTVR